MTNTQKRRAKQLAMLKIKYGNRKIPVTSDIEITDFDTIQAVAQLAASKYLVYSSEFVLDDENIPLSVDRGYKFTQKAIDLLEEASK